MRAIAGATLLCVGAVIVASCTRSTIRVVGVMHPSSEMRPLPGGVPLGGYQQLQTLVRVAKGQSAMKYGSPDCDFARLEGTDEGQDLKNAACVPVDAPNAAVSIVRQRLRSYGVTVVRDGAEPHDYEVDVLVAAEAPTKPDPALAKAVARVSFRMHPDASGKTLLGSIDTQAASAGFDAIAKACGFQNASLASFSATSTQPMTPDFDIVALAGDAVDNLFRCYDLARFFLDARQRFAKPQP